MLNVVVHTQYHVLLCTVLSPVLGMLILCGLLSHQIVGKVCTCYLSLCSILLSHNILFVTPGFVQPRLHFPFLLLGLPSIARSYYYYYYYVRNFRIAFRARLYIRVVCDIPISYASSKFLEYLWLFPFLRVKTGVIQWRLVKKLQSFYFSFNRK